MSLRLNHRISFINKPFCRTVLLGIVSLAFLGLVAGCGEVKMGVGGKELKLGMKSDLLDFMNAKAVKGVKGAVVCQRSELQEDCASRAIASSKKNALEQGRKTVIDSQGKDISPNYSVRIIRTYDDNCGKGRSGSLECEVTIDAELSETTAGEAANAQVAKPGAEPPPAEASARLSRRDGPAGETVLGYGSLGLLGALLGILVLL